MTKIYWSPVTETDPVDWSILYKDPTVLFDDLQSNMNKDIPKDQNLMYCPAVKDLTKQIVVVKCPMTSHYKLENNELKTISKNFISTYVNHQPNLKDSFLFNMNLSYIFFSEEDISMTITSPYFSKSPHLSYGSIVPGKLNISKWFRNINVEFNMWGDEFKIEENEDMLYCHFDTNDNIELVRFDMNKRMKQILNSCAFSSDWEKFVPLAKRYRRFKESKRKEILLKEIKNNIIESE